MVFSTWVQQSVISCPRSWVYAGPRKPGGCCPAGGRSLQRGCFYSAKEEFLLPGAMSSSSHLGSKTCNSPWLCFPLFPLPGGCPQPSPAERPQVTASSLHLGLNCELLNCQTCFLVGAYSDVLSATPSSSRSFIVVFLTDGYNKTANGFPA